MHSKPDRCCAVKVNSLHPPGFALRTNEPLDGLWKIAQRIQRVGVLPSPVGNLLNLVFLYFRETRAHSFFLDGFDKSPKPRRFFPVLDQFGDKFSPAFVLLGNSPFLFLSLPLLFPLTVSLLGFLLVLLDGCGGYGEPNHEVTNAIFDSLLFSVSTGSSNRFHEWRQVGDLQLKPAGEL